MVSLILVIVSVAFFLGHPVYRIRTTPLLDNSQLGRLTTRTNEELSRWGFTWWGVILVGSSSGELSWWGVVQVVQWGVVLKQLYTHLIKI